MLGMEKGNRDGGVVGTEMKKHINLQMQSTLALRYLDHRQWKLPFHETR